MAIRNPQEEAASREPSQVQERRRVSARRSVLDRIRRRSQGEQKPPVEQTVPEAVARQAEPFTTIEGADLGRLRNRIGERRVVLLGEATHGTAEFYRMRARISRDLIEKKGFRTVGLEADWPDAARIDAYARGLETDPQEWSAFSRFPTWMWRNREFREFVDWLHAFNQDRHPSDRVAVRGLDLYSLYRSVHAVVDHLEKVDPEAAKVARDRYACLMPWENDPVTYGHSASHKGFRDCEQEVVGMLNDLLDQPESLWAADGDRFQDMIQNARLVKNAERYYRSMYRGGVEAWNIRDSHMFETLKHLIGGEDGEGKAVVWAHNSHIGDARATQMRRRGEHNLGQLCRVEFPDDCHLVGFSTHTGTVAAADAWGEPVQIKNVRPSHEKSYERLAHESRVPSFFLPLRAQDQPTDRLMAPRLERAIGVVYRPESELSSHYFEAVLPRQFDELVWFDETRAVTPLEAEELEGVPETYPFGV